MEYVILVDENDNEVGLMEKMEAHQQALLHRAFSVFIFNSKGEMLLHQRSLKKYHCGGLWTNACCSHPRPEEATSDAAKRRLKEEMGIETSLEEIFNFTYQVKLDNGLSEHEFDHVFIGYFDGEVDPNYNEVEEFAWATLDRLDESTSQRGHFYTPWFLIALPKVQAWLNARQLGN